MKTISNVFGMLAVLAGVFCLAGCSALSSNETVSLSFKMDLTPYIGEVNGNARAADDTVWEGHLESLTNFRYDETVTVSKSQLEITIPNVTVGTQVQFKLTLSKDGVAEWEGTSNKIFVKNGTNKLEIKMEKARGNVDVEVSFPNAPDHLVFEVNQWGEEYSFYQTPVYKFDEYTAENLPKKGDTVTVVWTGRSTVDIKNLYVMLVDECQNIKWENLLDEEQSSTPVTQNIKAGEEFNINMSFVLDKDSEYGIGVCFACGESDASEPPYLYATGTTGAKVLYKGEIKFDEDTYNGFTFTKMPKVKLSDDTVLETSEELLEHGFFQFKICGYQGTQRMGVLYNTVDPSDTYIGSGGKECVESFENYSYINGDLGVAKCKKIWIDCRYYVLDSGSDEIFPLYAFDIQEIIPTEKFHTNYYKNPTDREVTIYKRTGETETEVLTVSAGEVGSLTLSSWSDYYFMAEGKEIPLPFAKSVYLYYNRPREGEKYIFLGEEKSSTARLDESDGGNEGYGSTTMCLYKILESADDPFAYPYSSDSTAQIYIQAFQSCHIMFNTSSSGKNFATDTVGTKLQYLKDGETPDEGYTSFTEFFAGLKEADTWIDSYYFTTEKVTIDSAENEVNFYHFFSGIRYLSKDYTGD